MSTTQDTVLVARFGGGGGLKYHTDPNCPSIREASVHEKTLDLLTDDYSECEKCAHEHGYTTNNDGYETDTECPYCGEAVKRLPDHIVKCEEATL